MKVYLDNKNAMMTNSYLLVLDNNDAYIIDVSSNLDSFAQIIEKDNLNLKAILLTHAHFDHIMGLEYVKNKYKVDIVCHIDEKEVLANKNINLSSMINKDMEYDADIYLEGKEGQYQDLKYILTPGHTKGGVCYLIDDILFTGDSLFQGSIGRTDFPGGDYDTLIDAIKNNLLVLNPNTRVLPGHGDESTIGIERINNPFLI